MATVTHTFVSGIADDPTAAAAGEVLPSHWNANHTVSGVRTILTANTNYYVMTGGSDSNDGSLAHPWATVQHASDFLSANLDFAGFTVTVNIGTGSFAGMSVQSFATGGILLFLGSGSANTTITAGPNLVSSTPCCFGVNSFCTTRFSIDAMTLDANVAAQGQNIVIGEYCTFVLGNTVTFTGMDIKFTNSGANTGGFCFYVPSPCIIFVAFGTATVNVGTVDRVFMVQFEGQIQNFGSWVFSSVTVGTANFVADSGGYWFDELGVAPTGTVTGKRFLLTSDSHVAGGNGTNSLAGGVNYFPGNSAGTADFSCTYDGFNFAQFISGLPTTSNLVAGAWGVFKDTSGGGVNVAYNDAGTIKKVALT